MAAPDIIGAEAPWNGQSSAALVEECLRERGLTNPDFADTDATLTSASTTQVALWATEATLRSSMLARGKPNASADNSKQRMVESRTSATSVELLTVRSHRPSRP